MTSHKPDMTGAKPDDTPAAIIAALLKDHAGLDLRLRAWDGSEAGPEKAPVVVIRSPRALQRIAWRPGVLGLAPTSAATLTSRVTSPTACAASGESCGTLLAATGTRLAATGTRQTAISRSWPPAGWRWLRPPGPRPRRRPG